MRTVGKWAASTREYFQTMTSKRRFELELKMQGGCLFLLRVACDVELRNPHFSMPEIELAKQTEVKMESIVMSHGREARCRASTDAGQGWSEKSLISLAALSFGNLKTWKYLIPSESVMKNGPQSPISWYDFFQASSRWLCFKLN